MGTYGLKRDTRNPFRKAVARLNSIGEGLNMRWDDDVTFTQAEVDTKVAEAVGAAKSGAGTFYDGFAQEVKEHPSVTRYKSVEELAKGHLELEKRIGLKGTLVPVEGSSDQVKNDFFKAVGRPDTADGYADPVLDNLHEGVRVTNEQDAKWFKDLAFEAGLSSKQKDLIHSKFLELQSQRLTDWDKLQDDEKNQSATGLRSKWGASYDEKLALANGLVKKFGSDALMEKVGSDPTMIEFLANLGAQLSEDKLGELGRSGMGMTPELAKQEIGKIQGNAEHPYNKGNDPLHDDAVKKVQSLYKIAYSVPT